MSSENAAISVRHLTKKYHMFDTPGQSFLYHVFKTNRGKDFVALDDVSFEVKKGESFGIIGKNGSGKSTLLQILAEIIKPTSGDIEIKGKVSALLELGSGFDPESTGYENIYMNAAILGVDKATMDQKVQEVIDFADIGEFISQPVKTYSSGMFIRLAFAVAINVDADIILIDEALAVGDLFFRQKCYSKLQKMKKDGKTIILVTHAMGEVEQFCDRAILLNKSNMIMIGDAREVVKKYYLINQKQTLPGTDDESLSLNDVEVEQSKNHEGTAFPSGWAIHDDSFLDLQLGKEVGTGSVKLTKAGIFDKNGISKRAFEQGERAFFYSEWSILHDIQMPLWGLVIFDSKNVIVHGKNTLQYRGLEIPSHVPAGHKLCVLQSFVLDIALGEYSFEFGFNEIPAQYYHDRQKYSIKELEEKLIRHSMVEHAGYYSVVSKKNYDSSQPAFYGVTNIPGDTEFYEVIDHE